MTRANRTTTQRGYGRAHQSARERLRPLVESGRAYCAEVVCLMPDRWIAPGTAWDLAHGATRNTYRGPAHATCNRSEGATRGNAQRKAQPPRARVSRRW